MKIFILILICAIALCSCSSLPTKTKSRRVINGRRSRNGEFTFMASVQHDGKHLCTGSILAKDVVLTSAHCYRVNPKIEIPASELKVGVANTFWRYSQKFQVEKGITHPQYDHQAVIHDIALLKTFRSMEGNNVSFIKLFPLPIAHDAVVEALALGWGFTVYAGKLQEMPSEELNHVRVKSVPSRICTLEYQYFGENQLCVKGANGGGTCNGDAGGPLVIQQNGEFFQIGIDSYGQGCDRDKAEVYTRISSYFDWIHMIMDKEFGEVGTLISYRQKRKHFRSKIN